MASALREIIARFGVSVDTKPLEEGNKKIQEGIGLLGKLAGALGAGLALGAVKDFLLGLTAEADALNKQARALGLSVQELQAWNYAAEDAGVSAEVLTATLQKIALGKVDQDLRALGVATRDASGHLRNATDILDDVAENLLRIKDPVERQRKAAAVLGKQYLQLLPLLEGGADGLRQMREEFAQLGGGFDSDFAERSEEFNTNLGRMRVLWKNIGITILSQIMPLLLAFSKRLFEVAKPLNEFIRRTELLKAAAVILTTKGILALSKAIGPLGAGLRMLLTQALPLIAAMLILEDIFVFLSGGQSAIGAIIDKLFGEGAADQFRKTLKEIVGELPYLWDYIKIGAQILWLELEAGFVHLAAMIADVFIDLWDDIVYGAERAWLELEAGFVNLAAMIGDAFIRMWNSVMKGAGAVLKVLDKVLPGKSAGAEAIDAWVQEHSGDANTAALVQQERERKRAELEARRSNRASSDLAATVAAVREQERLALARQFDAIRERRNQQPQVVNITNETKVTVPPGTPDQVANRVGKAAAQGTAKNNRDAAAALLHGQG